MSDTHSVGEPVRAVAYYRMSTDEQETSIPEQTAWARGEVARRAKERDLARRVNLVAEFKDEGITGEKRVENRPGLADLLAFVERAGDVEAIMVWDGDRLSRGNSIQTAAVLDRLMQAGVTRMLTPEGWTDFGQDLDRVMFNLRQDLTRAGYSKSLSKNIARASLAKARLGIWPAGRVPFGYRRGEDGKLGPHDPDAAVVRWIFDRYANTGASLGDLCVELSKSHPGRSWTRDLLRNWLVNEVYLGTFVWGKWPQGKYHVVTGGEVLAAGPGARRSRRAAVPSEGVIRVENNHPALVDRETFDSVARKLPANRWRCTPLRGGGGWTMWGLLVCGDCGQRMTGARAHHKREKKEYVYLRYVCSTPGRFGRGKCRSNSTPQDALLITVARLLRKSFRDRERLAVLRAQVEAQAVEAAAAVKDRAEALREEVARVEAQLTRATKRLAILDDDMVPLVTRQIREWQAERDALVRQRDELLQAAQEDVACRARVDEALRAIESLEETITTAPPELVRDALRALVATVTVYFDPGILKGKCRASEVEVVLVPEAVSLLGFTSSRMNLSSSAYRAPS